MVTKQTPVDLPNNVTSWYRKKRVVSATTSNNS